MKTTLAFGTAGIRAPLGPGPDRLNETTVAWIASAVLEEAADVFADARNLGVCIGYDGRTRSDAFAEIIARIALSLGFRTASFDEPIPTPLLAFTTRTRDACIGMMVTASHNPPHENGIKVYWRGGTQITAPHDRNIAERLGRPLAEHPEQTSRASHEVLGEADVERYLAAIAQRLAAPCDTALSIAYTALAGVGSKLTRRLLARHTPHTVHEVTSQAKPLADFGGLSTPNPEHPAALEQVLSLCRQVSADLAFAHDPDADRLAVAVGLGDREPCVLSGDEVGVLIGESLLARSAEPERELVASTLVSSPWLDRVAAHHGAKIERTLTGFKWIASRGRERAQREGLHFLYGYEEAIGYALADLSDDKDGLMALMLVAERAAELKAQHATLLDELERLARRDGLHASFQVTLPLPAGERATVLAAFLGKLRAAGPAQLLRSPHATWSEPGAELCILADPDGGRLCIRPSGTEAKLKLYLHLRTALRDGESYLEGRAQARAILEEQARSIAAL